MKENGISINTYKELICSLVLELSDERFLRQIYYILQRQRKGNSK